MRFDQTALLAPARLHEIHGDEPDRAAMLHFALAAAGARSHGPILLLRVPQHRQDGMAYGEGLRELGIDPARLVLIELRDTLALLRAGVDAARCTGIAAVLIESRGTAREYDLTASRRLTLAAEASALCVLMLRVSAPERPSAAQTRWRISAAPSAPLAANAPGPPAIHAELLRQRSGPAGQHWRLEWDAEHGCFIEAALPGAVVSLPALRKGMEGGTSAIARAA